MLDFRQYFSICTLQITKRFVKSYAVRVRDSDDPRGVIVVGSMTNRSRRLQVPLDTCKVSSMTVLAVLSTRKLIT